MNVHTTTVTTITVVLDGMERFAATPKFAHGERYLIETVTATVRGESLSLVGLGTRPNGQDNLIRRADLAVSWIDLPMSVREEILRAKRKARG